LAIFLNLRNQETNEVFRYERHPKNPQTLTVFSLPAGIYLLEKVYLYNHHFGNINFYHDKGKPGDIWKFIVKPDTLSYMGRISLKIEIDDQRKTAKANMLRDFKFDDDYQLLRRYYNAEIYRNAENINGFDGQPISYLGRSGSAMQSAPENRTTFRRVAQGSIYVNVVINNQQEVEMLLDTGCTKTLLREELARELGWNGKSADSVKIAIADGTVKELPTMKLTSLALGSAKVVNLHPVICTDCAKLYTANLLCNDFLNHFSVEIDNQNSLVILRYNEQ
jgi:clan AA aspartic protease (TIGR02281 family)